MVGWYRLGQKHGAWWQAMPSSQFVVETWRDGTKVDSTAGESRPPRKAYVPTRRASRIEMCSRFSSMQCERIAKAASRPRCLPAPFTQPRLESRAIRRRLQRARVVSRDGGSPSCSASVAIAPVCADTAAHSSSQRRAISSLLRREYAARWLRCFFAGAALATRPPLPRARSTAARAICSPPTR